MANPVLLRHDRLRVGSGMGTARAEDAQRTPTQSHISPTILVYGENETFREEHVGDQELNVHVRMRPFQPNVLSPEAGCNSDSDSLTGVPRS